MPSDLCPFDILVLLWLVGSAGWHEEKVVTDDMQSRSQMRAGTVTLVCFLKKQRFNLCACRKLESLWKKKSCPQMENCENAFLIFYTKV